MTKSIKTKNTNNMAQSGVANLDIVSNFSGATYKTVTFNLEGRSSSIKHATVDISKQMLERNCIKYALLNK